VVVDALVSDKDHERLNAWWLPYAHVSSKGTESNGCRIFMKERQVIDMKLDYALVVCKNVRLSTIVVVL
jgi:hypothetical protein